MAQETLRLDIVANNKDAVAALKQTDAELKKVASSALQTGSNVAKGSNQAANALTNLGRVAQDAPFGFIGIQNNLNPLLESFQRLKVETGSTSGALKSLAGSLIGPAGLGLALSVGGALLVAFGDKLFKTTQETEKATKFNESYTNSLAKERAQLDLLFQSATNANAPLVARKNAVKELRDNYGAYLKNFSDEEILAGKAATAYTELANAITMASKARAAQDAIVELQKKSIAAEIKLQEVATKAQQDAAKARDIAAKGTQGGYTRAITAEQQRLGIFANAQMEAKKLSEEIAGINKEINNYAAIALNNQIKPFTEETVKPIRDTTTAIKQATFNLNKYRQEMDGLFKLSLLGTPEVFAPKEKAQGMSDRTLPTSAAEIDNMITNARLANMAKIRRQKEDDLAYDKQAAEAMASFATSAFTSLGNAMLQGQDIGEALSNTFKRLIVDLTQMVARALIFKAIMASLSGGTSVIAGTAGGGGFLNIFKGLMGFANGGIASGPKSGYPVMLHGTEAVLNPKQFKNLTSNMMNVGALRGMGQSQPSSGQVVLRGQDLVLALDRAGVNLNLRRG